MILGNYKVLLMLFFKILSTVQNYLVKMLTHTCIYVHPYICIHKCTYTWGSALLPTGEHLLTVAAQLRQPLLQSLQRLFIKTPLIKGTLKRPSQEAGKCISRLLFYSKSLLPSLCWIPQAVLPANTNSSQQHLWLANPLFYNTSFIGHCCDSSRARLFLLLWLDTTTAIRNEDAHSSIWHTEAVSFISVSLIEFLTQK